MGDESQDKRSKPRTILDRYYSVEFSLSEVEFLYQFKIWNISQQGICVVVKEGSEILNHLKVGDILEMKYYPTDKQGSTEALRTEIRHITKDEQGRFKGHYLVGLSILERDETDQEGS
jgi:hypothetical protein